tara:strand:- start:1082 stop:2014 length:933 start_codon:yes stop_codon:yes gene_type:complete
MEFSNLNDMTKIKNLMVSSNNITKNDILKIFSFADTFQNKIKKPIKFLEGKILANCFFEPSTRTSLSFETAMKKLGGEVITFNKDSSSIKKGESDEDTIKTLEQYADFIVLRHPSKNLLYQYSNKCNKILINGGNGDGEHPTQALLDLYTITNCFEEKNTNLKILFVGDIKHSRTVHSLELIIKTYYSDTDRITIDYFPYPGCERIEDNNINSFEYINKYDVIYMTRLQKERFESWTKWRSSKGFENYILTPDLVSKMKENSIILHPLPRNEEIDTLVDEFKQAKYFEQMKNGVFVRMAILYYLYSNCNV